MNTNDLTHRLRGYGESGDAPPLILEDVRRAADNRHRRAIISVTGAAVMVAATAVGGNLLLTGTAPQTIAQHASPPSTSGTNRIARMAPGCQPNPGGPVAPVGPAGTGKFGTIVEGVRGGVASIPFQVPAPTREGQYVTRARLIAVPAALVSGPEPVTLEQVRDPANEVAAIEVTRPQGIGRFELPLSQQVKPGDYALFYVTNWVTPDDCGGPSENSGHEGDSWEPAGTLRVS